MNARNGCFAVVGLVLVILLCGGIYVYRGFFALNEQRIDVEAETGKVWEAVDTGVSKIGTLQNQVEFGVGAVQDIYAELAAARSEVLAAKDNNDLAGALAAIESAQAPLAELNSLVEDNQISLDVSATFITLLDETSGAYNRISSARSDLIDAQRAYASSCRTTYVFICPFLGGPIEILGSDYNASEPVSIPPMGGS